MIEKPVLECEWCGREFGRPHSQGPVPRYCSAAHRQRAYEARKATLAITTSMRPQVALTDEGAATITDDQLRLDGTLHFAGDGARQRATIDLGPNTVAELARLWLERDRREHRRAEASNDYSVLPSHPLHRVPAEVLEAARARLREVADYRDVDPELAEPIADSVVAALLEWLRWDDDGGA